MPTTTKKTVLKKVPAKKVASKKTATKRAAPKVATKKLVYADNSKSFWVTNGQILNSLLALQDSLAQMDKQVFSHHVNKDRHDFADWVERVLEDESCAAALRKTKTPQTAKTVVIEHLKFYRP